MSRSNLRDQAQPVLTPFRFTLSCGCIEPNLACNSLAMGYASAMSTVDVATFKAQAEELIAKAIAGEASVIEQNGKRAVLLPCEGAAPDLELEPETDALLLQRINAAGGAPTAADWQALRQSIRRG